MDISALVQLNIILFIHSFEIFFIIDGRLQKVRLHIILATRTTNGPNLPDKAMNHRN